MKLKTTYKQIDTLFAVKVYAWMVTIILLEIIILLLLI
jgi:hypothetical protein